MPLNGSHSEDKRVRRRCGAVGQNSGTLTHERHREYEDPEHVVEKTLECIHVTQRMVPIDFRRFGFSLWAGRSMPIGERFCSLSWPVQIDPKAGATDDVQAQLHAVIGNPVDRGGRLSLIAHPALDHGLGLTKTLMPDHTVILLIEGRAHRLSMVLPEVPLGTHYILAIYFERTIDLGGLGEVMAAPGDLIDDRSVGCIEIVV